MLTEDLVLKMLRQTTEVTLKFMSQNRRIPILISRSYDMEQYEVALFVIEGSPPKVVGFVETRPRGYVMTLKMADGTTRKPKFDHKGKRMKDSLLT